MRKLLIGAALCLACIQAQAEGWIRINQLGYLPTATKVAVYMGADAPEEFTLVDAYTGAEVFWADTRPTGPLGQMTATARL